MHVALGWEYRGHRVAPGPVVYCALEGAQGFRNRVEAFRQAKLSEADSGSPPFYLMAASLSLVADQEALIGDIRKQLDGRYRSLFVSTRSTVRSRAPKAPTKTWRLTSALPTQSATPSIASSSLSIIADMTAADREAIPRSWVRWMFRSPSVATPRATSSPSLSCPKMGKSDCNLCRVLSNGTLPLTETATPSCHASLRRVKARLGSQGPPSAEVRTSGLASAPQGYRGSRRARASVEHHSLFARVVTVDTWRRYCYQSGISDSDAPEARKKAFSRAHKVLVDGNHVQAHNEYRWISE